jgi:hypothetical protein
VMVPGTSLHNRQTKAPISHPDLERVARNLSDKRGARPGLTHIVGPRLLHGPARLLAALTKGGRCGGPEKLLDFLDIDLEDRRSALTFSMFALPRLLPWARCTAPSQSWEQRAVDVEDRRSSLTFSMFSLPRLALPWARCTASSQSWEQRAVDVEDRRSSLTFSISIWRTGEAR